MTKSVKGINVPNMRFPGFDGAWVTKKLGEITSWSSGGTPPKDNPLFWNGEIPWISASSMRGLVYSDSELKLTQAGLKRGSKLALKGSLLILVRGSMLFNKIPIGIASKDIAFNQDVKSIVVNEYSTSEYILNWFTAFESKILNLVTGTGIGAGKLDLQDLKDLEIKIPSLAEQQKVASFLSLLNERIHTQSKIIQRLETLMTKIREQLYAQKVRFRNENAREFPVWEEKRLDSFVTNFIVPMRDKPKDLTGEIPWCRIEDFDGKYLSSSKSGQGVNKHIIETMNLKVYPLNTLLVSCSANLGFCAITKKELITNQTFIGLVPNELKVNIEYLYYIMKLSAKKLNTLSSGTTISYLSREQFEQFKIDIPSIEEQNKIANSLSAIDKRIETEYRIMKQFEIQKKYLLSNLFI